MDEPSSRSADRRPAPTPRLLQGISAAGCRTTPGRLGSAAKRAFEGALRWRLKWLQALTLAVGLVATIASGLWMQAEIESDVRSDFAVRAGVFTDQLESRLRACSDAVYSVRALMEYKGPAQITREDFRRFTDSLAATQRYPGLLNVSFSRHLVQSERAVFEKRLRIEYEGLLPDGFAIKPPGERAEYDVVSYVSPLEGNLPAVGLDLAAEPLRNDAVRRARDGGGLTTTRGMKLLRPGEDSTMSVLLRLAVYEGGRIPSTLEARRRAYAGVAGVAIRLPDMIEATVSSDDRKQVRIMVEDTTDAAPVLTGPKIDKTVLYDSLAANGNASDPIALASYGVARRIAVGDRTWEIHVTPLADPIEAGVKALPLGTAASMLIISILVTWLLQSLETANARDTALRRNLKTLELNRQRLAETQEIAKIGAWEWDVRQSRQIWSDGLYRLLGRAVGDPPDPTDAFFIAHVVHPADINLVRGALKRVLEDGAPVDLECRVVLPDGSERIVSSITRLEAADDGERTRLVGTVRDITEQHRSAARERERLLFIQTMMDAIPIPVFQKDPEGRYQACNEAFRRFAGRTREQIIGKVFDGYAPGPHVEAMRAQDLELLARPAASVVEIKLPNSSGDLRQLMVHKASYLADDGRIAGLVGIIFDNTDQKVIEQRLRHTVAELDRRNAVSQLLGEFSEVLQSCMAVDEAYEMVAKYLPQLAPGSSGMLYRIDPAYRRGEKAIAWGNAIAAASVLAGDDCVAVRRSRARTVGDSTKELNCRHFTAEPPPAYACLPLLAHGELIGLLHVQRADTDPDREFASDIGWTALTTAAEHIGLALANLSLRETLREQATHDKLTGLYNRHYLNARFEQELARAKRKGEPLAVVMLDIDHFKRFNDTFGHAAGDHVLRELAHVVTACSRKSDVACRYGGEEFVLFLPETSGEIALKRAQKIRAALKDLHLEWEGQPLGTVTLSAGVATHPVHGNDPDTLLRVADRALYQAKQLGRDRAVLEPAPLLVVKCESSQATG